MAATMSVSARGETFTTFFPRTTHATANAPVEGVAADFNGDGRDDLATGHVLSGNVSVLLANGNGGLTTRTDYPVGAASVTTADFNNDGHPDLAYAVDSEVSVLLNQGDGSFGAKKDFATGRGCTAITAPDLNGDGLADIATVNFLDENMTVLINNGSGGFARADYYLPYRFLRSIAHGDFDGDGKLDLLVVSEPSSAIASVIGTSLIILRGNGNGGFADPVYLEAGPNPSHAVPADFNEDGFSDIVVVSGGAVRLFLANGVGGFVEETRDNLGSSRELALEVADFNGDGFLDIATAGYTNFWVREGDGTGRFAPPRLFYLNSTTSYLTSGDFNGDAKPDLACIIQGGDHVNVFINSSNSSPEIDLNGGADGTSLAVLYTEGEGRKVIAPDLTVADESGLIVSARVQILSPDGLAESLFATALPTEITATYNPVNGTLTLSGEASAADYQLTLRSVSYRNESLDPSDEPVTLRFAVNDGFTESTADASVELVRMGSFTGFVVTTTDDIDDGGPGSPELSLREAILAANTDAGAEVISFANGLSGAIELSSPLPALVDHVAIRGPGADVLEVRPAAGQTLRIFDIPEGIAAEIRDLSIRGGSTEGNGGGIANAGSLTLIRCLVEGHTATLGGGIFNTGKLKIEGSTISGNEAGSGGGIYSVVANEDAALEILNSTLSGNIADADGGGLANAGGTAIMRSSTIAANAAANGGGIASLGAEGAETTLRNTIVAGNTGSDIALFDGTENSFFSNGYNLIGEGDGADAFAATEDITGTTDPRLAPLQIHGGPTPTHLPLPDSPAIEAGNSTLATDQRGDARPKGVRDDIGSVELGIDELVGSLVVNILIDENNGTSSPIVGTGTSLREAIHYAASLDGPATITFDPELTGTIGIDSALPLIVSDLTIEGPGAHILTVSRIASEPYRIFQIESGATAEIRGLTITNGRIGAHETPANTGGNIYTAGTLTVADCVIAGGYAIRGGSGIQNVGELVVMRCTFRDQAGALDIFSLSFGGGIDNSGNATVSDSVFHDNTVAIGGAIANGGTMTLRNCTISGNSGFVYGGGIANTGSLDIDSCTISGNQTGSSGMGGGIAVLSNESLSVTLKNSIVAGNPYGGDVAQAMDSGPSFLSLGHNLIGGGSEVGSFTATGDITGANPQLGSLAFNGGPTRTRVPQTGSPALNAGSTTLTRDQRGVLRPLGGIDDIGAVEAGVPLTGPNFVVSTLDDISAADTAFSSLRGAIEAANQSPNASIITFAPGVEGRIALKSTLPEIDSDITLQGPGAGALEIGPADGGRFRILRITPDGDAMLRDLTLRGGVADGPNDPEPGDLTGYGGGILSEGILRIVRCEIRECEADTGGGIAGVESIMQVSFSTLADHIAGSGGAILNQHGSLELDRCAILDNTAGFAGGGIFNLVETAPFMTTMSVRNSTFHGNIVDAPPPSAFLNFAGGGAIYNFNLGNRGDLISIINFTTIVNNTSINGGGAGIMDFVGDLTLENSMLVGNTTVFPDEETINTGPSDQIATLSGTETLKNNLIGVPDGLTLGDIVEPIGHYGGPTATIPLAHLSPAIDGSPSSASISGIAIDQRGFGFPRVIGVTADIGAFESAPAFVLPEVAFAFEPGLSGKIRIDDLLASVNGGSGRPLTLVSITQPGQPGSTARISGNFIVYQSAPGQTQADSFGYTFTDGIQTIKGAIQLTISDNGDAQTFNIVSLVVEGDQAVIRAAGIPGRTYRLEFSDNLEFWTPLGDPIVVPAGGIMEFRDWGPLPSSRFYRVVDAFGAP